MMVEAPIFTCRCGRQLAIFGGVSAEDAAAIERTLARAAQVPSSDFDWDVLAIKVDNPDLALRLRRLMSITRVPIIPVFPTSGQRAACPVCGVYLDQGAS